MSSILAFTGGDAARSDQQPSPVSVLDATTFLVDGDSPSSSSGSKQAIDFSRSSVANGPCSRRPAHGPSWRGRRAGPRRPSTSTRGRRPDKVDPEALLCRG
ncbi:protein LONGIFOLIA 2 isoform X2 [Panicum miliaceum]|uniref:Protein LONGIFOLIA 2 isoform X2 n=1 Tax=Panicum miliaceum TaxID=4540 RepID=A0A3L6RRJ7_PANMI|nr:protein LONGIFOLIA 2 isoform X2 [Panicum miliaceum]